jgi:glycosyltransferase involved in cell wall biosynthesis
MTDLISIIIPVYNSSAYLDKCIGSVLMQTYKNIEVILVNDGSADDSFEICQKYAENDHRIKLINKDNGGVSSARNAGIRASSGRYIAFVDSDDTISPDFCSKMLEAASDAASSPHLMICGYDFINESTGAIKHFIPAQKNILNRKDLDNIYLQLFNDRHFLSVWGKLFSAEIIKGNGIYFNEHIHIGEDFVFLHEYLTHMPGINVKLLSEALYMYYVHKTQSLTKSGDVSRIERARELYYTAKDLYRSLGISDTGMYAMSLYYLRTLSIVFEHMDLSSKESMKYFKYAAALPETKSALSAIGFNSPESILYQLAFGSGKMTFLKLMLSARKAYVRYRR